MAGELSPAMQALYEGDHDRAEELLPPDDELTVFEAAAFGRVQALRAILDADPTQANALSPDGFTRIHLACFAGGQPPRNSWSTEAQTWSGSPWPPSLESAPSAQQSSAATK